MAVASDILTYARQMSSTDTNGITDAQGLAWANDAIENITRSLIERDINAAQLTEAYVTLNPTDNPPGQFAWPADLYALKTVEVDYSNVGGQQYLQAQALDVANIQFASWDYLRKNQSTRLPLFNNRGDTGEIFPTPVNATLIRIFYFKLPTEFTTTSSTVPYPLSLDYRCAAMRVAALYALSLEEETSAANYQKEYERRLGDIINILAPPSQQPIQATPIQISGWQF